MASGKQSRQRRQVRVPTPPPPGDTRRRQASPKVLLAAAAAIVLIAGGAGLVLALTGGSSSSASSTSGVPARGSLVDALPGAVDVQALFRGIAQHGNTLGSASAPVTMVEYADLQCPYCKEFSSQSLPTLLKRYVRSGKLQIQFRALAFIGPDSVRGRAAAIAAGQQNKMFNMIELFYDNQGTENTGWLPDTLVTAAAASIPGIDVPKLLADRSSSAVTDQAKTFDSQAQAGHIDSTPTILVGRSAATAQVVSLASPTDTAGLTAAIEAALP